MTPTVTVLGPVRVRRGDDEHDPGPRQRRLLAALVAHEAETVSSDRLVEIVWPGEMPKGADRSLKTYITRLRQALTEEDERFETGSLIEFRAPGYTLVRGAVQVDAAQFEFEISEAERQLRLGESNDSLRLIETALSRWTGRAYDEFADEDWARPAAVRLEERKIEAVQLHVRALLAARLTERAVAVARSLHDTEPLREGPIEALISALHADGRTAEALRVLPEFRARLGEEVGLEPSSELVELDRQVASGRKSRRATPSSLRGYELLERIGEGAFAVVHRALQPGIEREVAVKIIRPELADRAEFVRRFEFEAHLAARVEHPYVVPLHDFWREPGAAFLVMQLMRGGSIADLLARSGRLESSRVSEVVEQVGSALAHAHTRGVIHRDVRPANILLDDAGRAFLADFGIAGLTSSVQESDPLLGSSTSPAYAAPEVLQGEPATASADVLSLAVTSYEMLAGHAPFADTPVKADLIRRQINDPLPSVDLGPISAHIDPVLARATSKHPAERHQNVESFISDLLEALDRPTRSGRGGSSVHPASFAHAAENPYLGLRRFDEADAHRFFGREEISAEIAEKVGTSRFVAVVGPSGAGKSSIVRAGVLPLIRGGLLAGSDHWFVSTMMPGSSPFEALEAALVRVAVDPPVSLLELLHQPNGIDRAIRRVLPGADGTLLLVIDQFEELFTLTDRETRLAFLDLLSAALEGSDHLRLLTTIRSDQLDGPLGIRSIAAHLDGGAVLVGPMAPQDLEQAVVRPAQEVGVQVDPALVATMLAEAADHPSLLPLVQVSLESLFDTRRAGVMTLDSYHSMGGISGVLSDRAESLVPDDESRRAVRALFSRLVVVDGDGRATRRRAMQSEFGSDPQIDAVIERFGQARLISFDHDETTREPTVEVTHEALLEGWDRLANWVQEDRDDLRTLTRVTSSNLAFRSGGEDGGDLARGAFLTGAADLASRRPDWLTTDERDWVGRSVSLAEAENEARELEARRQAALNRKLRRALAVAGILLIAAISASVVAVVLRNRAVAVSDDAEVARLVALSQAEAVVRPDRAALLALEAHRRDPSPETTGAVLNALASAPPVVSIIPSVLDNPIETLLSTDGSTALQWSTSETGGDWVMYDLNSPVDDPQVHHEAESFVVAALSGDGQSVAFSGSDRIVRVISPAGERTVVQDESLLGIVLDHEGKTVLLEAEHSASLFDVETSEQLWRIEIQPPNRMNTGGAIAVDGSVAAFLTNNTDSDNSEEGEIVVVGRDGMVVRRTSQHLLASALALSNDGSEMVSGGLGGLVVLHSVMDDDPADVRSMGSSSIYSVDHDEGSGIVAVDLQGEMNVWSPSGRLIMRRQLPEEGTDVKFGEESTLSLALRSGEIWRLDLEESGFWFDRQIEPFSHIGPFGIFYDTPNEDFTKTVIRRLDSGEVVVEVGFDASLDGVGSFPTYSDNGEWLTLWGRDFLEIKIGVGRTFGSERSVMAIDDLAGLLLGRPHTDDDIIGFRVSDDGLIFLAIGVFGDAAAGWIDPSTQSLVAGPFELSRAASSLVLPGGAVVIGDADTPLQWLPPRFEGEPRLLIERAGFEPLAYHQAIGVVAINLDGTVALVDLETDNVRYFAGEPGLADEASISPDGSMIAVGVPGAVLLIDVATGERIGAPLPVERVGRTAPGMAWTADSSSLWVNAELGPRRISVDPAQWIERACGLAGGDLTPEEWAALVSPTESQVTLCGNPS